MTSSVPAPSNLPSMIACLAILLSCLPIGPSLAAGPVKDEACIWVLGDSLTQSYQGELARILPERTIVPGGYGGQSSTQIAARAGARPIVLSFAGDAIPATGSVAVTSITPRVISSSARSGEISGSVAGRVGKLTRDATDSYVFAARPDAQGTKVPPQSQFVPDTGEAQACVLILWAGHINVSAPSTVLADIDAIISAHAITGGRYLVLSLLTSANYGTASSFYKSTSKINDVLARKFGDRFIDIRSFLVEKGWRGLNLPLGETDKENISRGVVPAVLRQDHIHLNTTGSRLVAGHLAAAIRDRGW